MIIKYKLASIHLNTCVRALKYSLVALCYLHNVKILIKEQFLNIINSKKQLLKFSARKTRLNIFIKTRHDVQGKCMGVVGKWEQCTVLELIIIFK